MPCLRTRKDLQCSDQYHPSHIFKMTRTYYWECVSLHPSWKEYGVYHSDNTVMKQQAHISKLAKSLPPLGNTVVPFVTIESHSSSWQAHLERISDFLMVSKEVWWTSNQQGDVEFFDGEKTGVDSRTEGPKLHHFRLSNFKTEEAYLIECWSLCLEAKIPYLFTC